MKVTAAIAATVSLLLVAGAWAVPPMLGNVSHEKRHPKAAIAAPRADFVTVYIASRPERATDGSFLSRTLRRSTS